MRLTVKDVDKCIGCQSCMFACARRKGDRVCPTDALVSKEGGGVKLDITNVLDADTAKRPVL